MGIKKANWLSRFHVCETLTKALHIEDKFKKIFVGDNTNKDKITPTNTKK